jgi:uncharacterized SAM-binding protein YcdF (DUF218 family)
VSAPFDCIVVLGHTAYDDDPVMRARVGHAVSLYREGVAGCLIMSGRWSFKLRHSPPERTEAEAMRDYAASLGLPAHAFLLEYESTDTLSNAYFTKVRFLMPLDWRRVCVVTTEEHSERARWLFARVLGPAYQLEMRPAPAVNGLAEGLERNARLLRQIQDALAGIDDGDHDAIADLLFTRHPGYVDDPEAVREIEAALL